MRKFVPTVLTVLALCAAASSLTACQTTAGAGKDIANTGNAISSTAQKNAP